MDNISVKFSKIVCRFNVVWIFSHKIERLYVVTLIELKKYLSVTDGVD
jgi:hypothetical protein